MDERRLLTYGIIAIVLLTAASLFTNPAINGFLASIKGTPTGYAALDLGKDSLKITFYGDPEVEQNSGFKQSFLGEPAVITQWDSINLLNKLYNVERYSLESIDLDEGTYTYSVLLGSGADIREAAESYGRNIHVKNIG